MSSSASARARGGDHPPSFEPIHEQVELVKPENGRDTNRPIVEELGARMKHVREELMTKVDAQKAKVADLHDHLDTMSRAIRKASGVDLANPDLDLIQEQVDKFERAVVEIHAKWVQLKAIAEAAPPAPAPAEPAADKKKKKKDGHGHSDKPARARHGLGEHHWQESEEDKDPILDIPSSVLEKIIPAARYMEAYEAIARDKDSLGTPSASGEPLGLTKIKELFDLLIAQEPNSELLIQLERQGYTIVEFQDLWKDKLSTKIYHVLEQVVQEDVGQMAEQKMTALDKFKINAPTIAAKATVSGLTIGLAAGTAGAAATFVGAGVGTTMAASGLAGATAHRTKTTWWSRARDSFNNIGKTGAAKREKSIKIKREEALQELLESAQSGASDQAQVDVTDHGKTREMASWISQGLRDASAAETIAHEAKPSNTAQKTGLRERDDANLYLFRMSAAVRLKQETDTDLRERKRTKLDELTNGLNGQRETAAGQATYLENVYKTNTNEAQAKRDLAPGATGGNIRTLGGGMLIGTTIMELGGVPVGPFLGGAILGRDRGNEKNAEAITKGFEANVKKVAVDAKKLVDEVRRIVRLNYSLNPSVDVNPLKKKLLRHNKELEVILNSGVLKKDHKALELAVRDTLHDGRRLYLAEDLDREQNGPAGAREETDKQVKRLTKKPGTFWRKTRNVLGGAVIAVGLNLGAHHAVEKIHEWRDAKPVDPPEAVPTAVVPEATPDETESEAKFVVEESRPAEPEVAAPVEAETEAKNNPVVDQKDGDNILRERYVTAIGEVKQKWETHVRDILFNPEAQDFVKATLAELEKMKTGDIDQQNLALFADDTGDTHQALVEQLSGVLFDQLTPEAKLLFANLSNPDFATVDVPGFDAVLVKKDGSHGIKIFSNGQSAYLYSTHVLYGIDNAGYLAAADPVTKESVPISITLDASGVPQITPLKTE